VKYDLVIRSGRVVTPNGVVMGDLGVSGGVIAAIGQGIESGKQEIDATGRVVFPGIVDAHVHLGVPDGDDLSADDVESGTRAAAYGGVTTVIDFSVQQPGESLIDSFERRKAGIPGKAYVDVGLHVNITDFTRENLAQVPELVERGAPSFKIFTAYAESGLQLGDEEIIRVADVVGRSGALLMLHAENGDAADFLGQRLRDQGKSGAIWHEPSRPDVLEAEAIHRVATLAQLADCPLYVVHLSTARGLEVIRRFREEGWLIHTETCPQYLLLDRDSHAGEVGHRFITCPPLRERHNLQVLTEAIYSGEIEVVATDHCPFTMVQKDFAAGDFGGTPGGLPGVETLFPLMFSHLVALGDGGLTPRSNASLILLARVLAENPARLFGIAPAKGALREGADADFLIFDPNPIRHIRSVDLHGNADWTPFEGSEVRGEIRAVYLRGERVMDGGQLYAQPGAGRFLPGRLPLWHGDQPGNADLVDGIQP
jgi:dihydropyrimidinase